MSERLPQRAIALYRMSLGNREENIRTQSRNVLAYAEQISWRIAFEMDEDGVSAFKKTLKRTVSGHTQLRTNRPKFEEILRLFRSGAADGLVARDATRVVRDLQDWAELLAAREEAHRKGFPWPVIETVKGDLRLRGGDDVLAASIAVEFAIEESRRIASRVRDGKRESALRGGYHGSRPRGYRRTTTPEGKSLWTEEPTEADWIIRIKDMLLYEGATLGECVRLLNREEALYPDRPRPDGTEYHGTYWAVGNLRAFMRKPIYAGHATYHGQIVRDAGGKPIKGTLPAIFPPEEHEALVAALQLRPGASGGQLGNRGNRGGNGRNPGYLGTGLFWCGQCDEEEPRRESLLRATTRDYYCLLEHSGRLGAHGSRRFRIAREPVDRAVSEAIITEAEKPEAARWLHRPAKPSRATAQAAKTAARLRQQIAVAQGKLAEFTESTDIDALKHGIELARQRLKEVEIEPDRDAGNSPLQGFAGNPDARALWAGYSLAKRRAIVDRLAIVYVDPPAVRYHPIDPDCVEIFWKPVER